MYQMSQKLSGIICQNIGLYLFCWFSIGQKYEKVKLHSIIERFLIITNTQDMKQVTMDTKMSSLNVADTIELESMTDWNR